MIDVIDVRLVALRTKIEDVANDREEILSTQVLHALLGQFTLGLSVLGSVGVGRVMLKLTVDSEASDATNVGTLSPRTAPGRHNSSPVSVSMMSSAA